MNAKVRAARAVRARIRQLESYVEVERSKLNALLGAMTTKQYVEYLEG